jgi:hypothetical protein
MIRRVAWAYLLVLFIYRAPLVNAQPAPCTAKDGSGIVACVAATYPEKLVAGISVDARVKNMQFLRDRIIETARCAGLDVGLNLKRGGPSISNDFIAWRNGDVLEGVDIASGYDDATKPLKLMWHRYKKEESYGFPFYKAYGPVVCVGQPDPTPTPIPVPTPNADIEALKAQNAALLNRLEALETELRAFARVLHEEVAQANTRIDAEEMERVSRDTGLGQEIEELRSRPIPTGCSVQFGLRCRLVQ